MTDKVTAYTDYSMDAKIQKTLYELNCTIITISYRLQTIIDYGKVLVLDKYEVVNFGRPHYLLKNGEDAILQEWRFEIASGVSQRSV